MVRLTVSAATQTLPTPNLPEAPWLRHDHAPADRLMTDAHGRTIRDLRLSITDRCNFRCVYCMDPDVRFLPQTDLLSVAELVRLARLCVGLGVRAVRITGGEPTLRPDLDRIIAGVADLGVDDVSMTTNGTACTPANLARWKRLGLKRVTFSLDAVSEGVFADMTRSRGTSAEVIAAVQAAIAAGLGPVKVNAVIIRSRNEDQIGPLTRLAADLGFEMRFIEYMPLDSGRHWDPSMLVPASQILARAAEAAPLVPLGRDAASSTAEVFGFADPACRGRVGVIAPVTRPFCGACSRLRITADGQVRPCLFSLEEYDLRAPMRAGEDDRRIEQRLLHAVRRKQAGHGIGHDGFRQPDRSMSAIGG